jgi:nicotinate-nucleotide pyrophosphorylase (carboxylating)
MTFSPTEAEACNQLIKLALEEDLDRADDLTSMTVIPANIGGRAIFVARSPGVIAGVDSLALILEALSKRHQVSRSRACLERYLDDGWDVDIGTAFAMIGGPMRTLLAMERTALNFVQRLSGVATQTRRFVDAVKDLPVQILDTRKTTPGWRLLEKYAVRCGGGKNHRMGLFDAFLIKDNHLAALGGGPGAITEAVRLARETIVRGWPSLEIEVDDLNQLEIALAERPDIILLDNMSLAQMREAVRRRNAAAPQVKLEASGGVTLQTVRAIAETGVERISVGALTHSAPALDIALDYEKT